MRIRVALSLTMLSACAAPPQAAMPQQPAELVGRTAGAPQRCVPIDQAFSLRVSATDRHALVYGHGKTVWVNRLGTGCGFGPNDVPVLEPTGSQYCRGDLVRTLDTLSRIPGPACVLGDFVPYSRS